MLVSQAFAQSVETTTQAGGDLLSVIVQFVVILAVLYFILIRPQQKKVKKQMEMLNAIKVGDKVSVAGIIGKVVKTEGNELMVRIAPETDIRVMRLYVSDVLMDEKELLNKKEK